MAQQSLITIRKLNLQLSMFVSTLGQEVRADASKKRERGMGWIVHVSNSHHEELLEVYQGPTMSS